jgi:2-dehydro-3-deoxy-D-arabinonate dehydratase
MKICRYQLPCQPPCVGLTLDDQTVLDLTARGVERLETVLEQEDPLRYVEGLSDSTMNAHRLANVTLLPPVERQEVWAAGVTYLRSKAARMAESDFSATAYDRVYAAQRPELFFKAQPEKVVATEQPVGVRADSKWSVPEPELALVFNSRGRIAGYTIGNDMSARDIEGENLLYLPQAKIYDRSCALGPFIVLGASETTARTWKVDVKILRDQRPVFAGETEVSRIKRGFAELGQFLFRSQTFPRGAVLLTGTGVVPPDDFTLLAGDVVEIGISGIGLLRNPVVKV